MIQRDISSLSWASIDPDNWSGKHPAKARNLGGCPHPANDSVGLHHFCLSRPCSSH